MFHPEYSEVSYLLKTEGEKGDLPRSRKWNMMLNRDKWESRQGGLNGEGFESAG